MRMFSIRKETLKVHKEHSLTSIRHLHLTASTSSLLNRPMTPNGIPTRPNGDLLMHISSSHGGEWGGGEWKTGSGKVWWVGMQHRKQEMELSGRRGREGGSQSERRHKRREDRPGHVPLVSIRCVCWDGPSSFAKDIRILNAFSSRWTLARVWTRVQCHPPPQRTPNGSGSAAKTRRTQTTVLPSHQKHKTFQRPHKGED